MFASATLAKTALLGVGSAFGAYGTYVTAEGFCTRINQAQIDMITGLQDIARDALVGVLFAPMSALYSRARRAGADHEQSYNWVRTALSRHRCSVMDSNGRAVVVGADSFEGLSGELFLRAFLETADPLNETRRRLPRHSPRDQSLVRAECRATPIQTHDLVPTT